MTVATIVGGASFALVHKIAPHLAPGEYSIFTTLIQVVNGVTLAAMGFQIVLAKVVAETLTEQARLDAAAAARGVLLLASGFWLLLVMAVIASGGSFRSWVGAVGAWPWVWLSGTALCLLFQSTCLGVLQGSQDFLWFGAISILSGAGRLLFVWVLVAGFGLAVTGAMAGVFAASLLCAAVAGWRTRSAVTLPGGAYRWKELAQRCLFLVCGVGTLSLLLSLDQLMSRRYLRPAEMDFYAVAGTIGRVVVLITVPLTNVMFPKVARSMAEDSRPAAFVHALALVGLVGVGAALVCSIFPALPIRLLQGNKFLEAAPLVPLFAWAVLPLTLTNILVNNLLARGRFGVVPLLVLVTTGYWLFLQASHDSARAIIRALFAFASLACLVSGVCCWMDRRPGRKSEGAK